MFDLGIQELIVIFIVALIVFGPKRLPELGRTLGKGIAELKRAVQGVKEQMDEEFAMINNPVQNNPPAPGKDTEKNIDADTGVQKVGYTPEDSSISDASGDKTEIKTPEGKRRKEGTADDR